MGRRTPEQRAWHIDYMKRRRLAKWGLTLESYQSLHDGQGGACAICGAKHERLCIDHDHETGVVRGLLCQLCNRSIGQLGDSFESVQRAADYLWRAKFQPLDLAA
jgi:hypothetical protein